MQPEQALAVRLVELCGSGPVTSAAQVGLPPARAPAAARSLMRVAMRCATPRERSACAPGAADDTSSRRLPCRPLCGLLLLVTAQA